MGYNNYYNIDMIIVTILIITFIAGIIRFFMLKKKINYIIYFICYGLALFILSTSLIPWYNKELITSELIEKYHLVNLSQLGIYLLIFIELILNICINYFNKRSY